MAKQNVRGCGISTQPQRMVICECPEGMPHKDLADKYERWLVPTITYRLYAGKYEIHPMDHIEEDIENIKNLNNAKNYIIRFRFRNFRGFNKSGQLSTKKYGKVNISLVSTAIVLMKNNPYRNNWDMIYG